MRAKYIIFLVVAVIVVGAGTVAYFVASNSNPVAFQATPTAPVQQQSSPVAVDTDNVANSDNSTVPQATPSVTPSVTMQPQDSTADVSADDSSVAGVDLSGLSAEASDSVSVSKQDGASDTKVIPSDKAFINSSANDVNDPL